MRRVLLIFGILVPALIQLSTAGAQVQPPVDAQTALVRQYCAGCHGERTRSGGLSLATFVVPDAADKPETAETAEKMIRKLRAGMMPPPGARRPDERALALLAETLETNIDKSAAANPRPGWRPFQRLNRVEYARAVKDLLALDVDVTPWLPPDTISGGFDNVADSQAFSPALMDGYLRAASRIAALAVGDPDAQASEAHYRVPKTASQLQRVDGAPFGTRGGISVVHVFPADGDYVFRVDLHGNADGFLFGGPASGEQLEVSINGARQALLDVDRRMAEVMTGLTLKTPPIHVQAGPQRVTAAFLQRFEGPVNDLVAPIDHTLADTQIGVAYGVTTLPHLKDLSIVGPQNVTGVSDTPSRRKIFACRPAPVAPSTFLNGAGDPPPARSDADASSRLRRPLLSMAAGARCEETIVRTLATQAFRRPVTDRELQSLMRFYEEGRKERDFENGVRSAIEAILASPQFVFRLERTDTAAQRTQRSASMAPHGTQATVLSDRDLASRLSFFLWGAGPDAELMKAASSGQLSAPGGLDKQVTRMLADSRSAALSTRFARQWLRLNDVEAMLPDALLYPYYDHTLGESLVRETELFFDSIVREDRSVLDLLTADYTFVNERIARHYGIPNVTGPRFRRVTNAEHRYGILGQGSVLVLTSVADRTSPVMRGKWVMEVLLGSPPPPPPPNVPPFEATSAASGGKLLSVRERMEEHRKNPACASCHRVIDPLGLALENFDPTGRWRIKDNEVAVDPAGVLYDGTKMNGPEGLRDALLKHQDVFLQTFTGSLMTYALGRRVEYSDMPIVRAIVRNAGADRLRISSFVRGIVNSAAFREAGRAPERETSAERQP